MLNIKVSVIIPVYNTGEYLSEAITSVVTQSLSEIEIIAVNDGSTDDSLKILEEFASSDSRVRVYSQDNRGQSVARNLGLTYATGEYIYFMDSDDVLHKEALLECYVKSKEGNLDLVFFDAKVFGSLRSNSFLSFDYRRTHLFSDVVYPGPKILQKLVEEDGYSASPWLYLVKRNFLEYFRLSFYPGIIHEDELFTFQVFLCAGRVGLVNRSFFCRRIRYNSTMTTEFSRKNIEGYYTVARELYNLKNSERQLSTLIDKRIRTIIGGVFYNSRKLTFIDRCFVALKFLPYFKCYISFRTVILMLCPIHHLFLRNT